RACPVHEVRCMPVTVSFDDLMRATGRLRQHPFDTGAWLDVAVLLHALGATDDAELAFATIGEGARVGGQVALAVACARHQAALGELHSGAFFGEIALVGGMRRTARVTACDDVWLLEIPARAIATAATKHPQLAEVLASHARARLLANLTRTSELFRALGDADRHA